MFDMKKPCKSCPFRKTEGGLRGLHPDRLAEILTAAAFQCHKTVDYDAAEDDPTARAGDRPQQCAGWIAMTRRAGLEPQIVQLASRLLGFDPDQIIADDVFGTVDDLHAAHALHSGKT